ncbi:Glutathione S-transferase U17 [Striga hermonthica]|uniref:glutathione transferase n=1 Tax=Striga hermonthica TaxID=68872 RepID=A0A9N7RLR3_STRHE|nr:Glutathione S-transferase U17 [Striga hermonthica]
MMDPMAPTILLFTPTRVLAEFLLVSNKTLGKRVISKALVLVEITNYIQSLQRQVEFLSMKLEAVNARETTDGYPSKDGPNLGMAKGDDVQLLGSWASPYSNRVHMALNLKSIDFEFIEENYYSNKSDRLLKANPVHRKIPVLIHHEKPVCESLLIIQYIDEVWNTNGPKILPSDPYDRAMARFWAAYIDDTWFPLFIELFKTPESGGDEARATILAKISEGVALLEEAFGKCSQGKDYFGGDSIGYMDVVLGSYLSWVKVTQTVYSVKLVDESKAPGLAAWAERFISHEAAKDVVPDVQKLVQFFMMVRAATSSSSD